MCMKEEKFVFTAVIRDNGFALGAASEGTKGYSPTTYDGYETYEKASEHAKFLNDRLGWFDEKEAMRIVLGTMGYGEKS